MFNLRSFSFFSMKILLRGKIRQVILVILMSLVTLFVLELGFYLFVVPQVRLQKLTFEGSRWISDAEVRKLLGIEGREYYFLFDEQKAAEALQGLPWVYKAVIKKIFPDTLIVGVESRNPIAICLVGQGYDHILMIDQEGMIFRPYPVPEHVDLPLVSGIGFRSLQPGMRLSDSLVPLFQRLIHMKTHTPVLYNMISEMEFQKNDREGYDFIFYPQHVHVRLLLREDWSSQQLYQASVLLDLVERQNWAKKTKEIDLRTTPAVFRPVQE